MKRKNALILFVLLALLLLALDRLTKVVAIEQLSNGGSLPFIPGVLDFVLVYNRGGAFGIFEGGGTVFVVVALVAVVVIIAYLLKAKKPQLLLVIILAMIASGALGNAYDRAINGAVPDFIHTLFVEFPVFNVADCCLTVGEIALIIAVLFSWIATSKTQKHSSVAADGARGLADDTAESITCFSVPESGSGEKHTQDSTSKKA